jgi:hypothetical protein
MTPGKCSCDDVPMSPRCDWCCKEQLREKARTDDLTTELRIGLGKAFESGWAEPNTIASARYTDDRKAVAKTLKAIASLYGVSL